MSVVMRVVQNGGLGSAGNSFILVCGVGVDMPYSDRYMYRFIE